MTAELRVGPLHLHRMGVELCSNEVVRLFMILDVNGDEALEMGEIVDAIARTEEERRRIDKDCLPGIHHSDCTELVEGLCAKFGEVLNLEQFRAKHRDLFAEICHWDASVRKSHKARARKVGKSSDSLSDMFEKE